MRKLIKVILFFELRFESFNWQSLTCRTTIENNTPHAISTLNLVITKPHPPNCPNKFIKTNNVARNCEGNKFKKNQLNDGSSSKIN